METPTRTLTDFMLALMRADPAAIARADPVKMAAKWELPVEVVRFNLEWRLGR